MPRHAFPLSRSHSYPLGSGFDWCVCEAIAGADAYRLLVAFDPAKAQYRAWLGLICGHDTKLLARLEYHPDHKGWHVHAKIGPVAEVVRGIVKEPRNRDRSRGCPNAPASYNVSQVDALSIAFHAFNVSTIPMTKSCSCEAASLRRVLRIAGRPQRPGRVRRAHALSKQ